MAQSLLINQFKSRKNSLGLEAESIVHEVQHHEVTESEVSSTESGEAHRKHWGRTIHITSAGAAHAAHAAHHSSVCHCLSWHTAW